MVGVMEYPLKDLPYFLFAGYIKYPQPVWSMLVKKTHDPLRLYLFPNRSFRDFISCPHDLILCSDFPQPFLISVNITINQKKSSGTSSSGPCLVIHSTHWSTLWVGHTSSSDLIQAASQPYFKWTTEFLVSLSISVKDYSIGTPNSVATATNISEYQDSFMLPISIWFLGSPTKIYGGIFPTAIGFYASIIFCVNKFDWWLILNLLPLLIV